MTPSPLRQEEQQRQTPESKYFEMLLYTSWAGRSGMLLFTRVKKAIFSLEQQAEWNNTRS